MLEYLTTLDDNDNQISEFEKVGDKIFIISSKGKAIFVDPKNPNEKPEEIELGISVIGDDKIQNDGAMVIIDYMEMALVITNKEMTICKEG